MIPLHVRLKLRYRRLRKIRASFADFNSQVLTYQILESLRIDACPLDIDTGATSDSVTACFLPRTSFPSCRDMVCRTEDKILKDGQMYYKEQDILSKFLGAILTLTYDNYAHEGNKDLEYRMHNSDFTHNGWKMDRSYSGEHAPGRRPWFKRMRRYLNDSRSHAMTQVEVNTCHEELPSINKIAAAVEEIMDAMKTQRKKLRSMAIGEPLTTFHHIIPRLVQTSDFKGHCRILYAYFDGRRLKVQFTQLLDLAPMDAVIPPPDRTYGDVIDLLKYYDTMDRLLKWAWPIVQGDTGMEGLADLG